MVEIVRNDLIDLIKQSLKEVLGAEDYDEACIDVESELVGEKSVVDSIGLIEIVTFLEDKIEERYGAVLTLFDDEVFEEDGSFQSISVLSDHILDLLKKEQ